MPDPTDPPPPSGADVLADHIINCTGATAALVADGNADDTVAKLIADGWTYDGNVEYVAGKRVRILIPPPEVAAHLAAARERGNG